MTSTLCARNLPQHFNGCVCTADPAVTAEAHVDLVATLDDEAQAADYMTFMERTMGSPPEPETGYCAECGNLWIEDPHGSPGVKVHYDPESPNTIDHATDEDHTPVPEDDDESARPYSSEEYPHGRCGACGFGLDEHGSCYQHDCSAFNADSPLADIGSTTSGENVGGEDATDLDESEDEIVHEFQALGSSSSFAVTYSEADDDYSFYRDGTFVGSFDHDGWSTDHAAIEQAALRVFPVEAPVAACTDETGHLPGQDHRWQECPTYRDDDEN